MNKREVSNVLKLTLETLMITKREIQIYKEKNILKHSKTPQNDFVKMSLWLKKIRKKYSMICLTQSPRKNTYKN